MNPHPLPGPGRPAGVPNKLSLNVQKQFLDAVVRHGSDGAGTGGQAGYLDWAIRTYPREAFLLFGKMLPREVTVEVAVEEEPRPPRTSEEIRAELEAMGFQVYDQPLPEAIMKYAPRTLDGRLQILDPDPDDPDDESCYVPIPKLRP